jgi:hypothetical protein
MSIAKPTHVICFAISVGLVAYLASALWSALFIVSLPLDPDAVVDSIELDRGEDRFGNAMTEWRPVKFKNGFEELKYFHNRQMTVRNRYWLYAEVSIAGLTGVFAFFVVPKWRKISDDRYEPSLVVIEGALVGCISVIVIPFFLGLLLPAPVKWFPRSIVAISEQREKAQTELLKRVGSEIDQERMGLDQ